MARLTILDLDRTLFDSGRFLTDLLGLLAIHYQVNAEAFRAGISGYRAGDWYDFHRHVAAVTGLDTQAVATLAAQGLAGRSYLYADVTPWLSAAGAAGEKLLIMTVGTQAFQSLKFNHAPELAGVPHWIVKRNKGQIIAERLAPAPGGWRLNGRAGEYDTLRLVDDNPTTHAALGSHPAITAYHLARPGEPYSDLPTPPGARRITTLLDLNP
jgi:hypothetical protein